MAIWLKSPLASSGGAASPSSTGAVLEAAPCTGVFMVVVGKHVTCLLIVV